MLEKDKMMASIRMACDWLTDIAQTGSESLPGNTEDRINYAYRSWKGAIRSEYNVAEKKWWYFCPVWHTGQAIKALVPAADFLRDDKYLHAARRGADFIFDKQIWDKNSPDHGLILAFENFSDKVNITAIMECMDGLMMLADKLQSPGMWDRLTQAGYFMIDKAYMRGEGVFRDAYDPARHEIVLPNPYRTKNNIGGAPIYDDSVLLKLFDRTRDNRFKDIHLEVSERLLADQNPPGNWLDYRPCNPEKGYFHPRQAYWYSLPLLDTWRITGRKEFLETVIASGKFSEKAMRADGGYFRGYYLDGKTDSFGHATSGSACSAILWLELFRETGDSHWPALAEKALEYCMKMQFTKTQDNNLQGAILEKVLPPDGSDRSPYYIRDLGTIFYIIAAIKYLQLKEPAI